MKYNAQKLHYTYKTEHYYRRNIMGKKPLNEQQVKSLRKIVSDKPLHELLLNLAVDLMLRSSDLLSLRVKDVMNDNGSVKK